MKRSRSAAVAFAGSCAAMLLVSLGLPVSAAASAEGCQVFDPVQRKCTYTVTHTTISPVSGFSGTGDWVAKVKRGKKRITVESPAGGEPTVVEFSFQPGDKVTLTALSPGSGAVAGHVD
jgi:hypothetical protein